MRSMRSASSLLSAFSLRKEISMDTTLIFGIITAAGTFITIAVIIWNDGKTKGEIKQQITALQKDVIRQNGDGSQLSEKVERKVEKDDCIRIHDQLTISITELLSERQQSEERIITAIRKRRSTPARTRKFK